MQYLSIALPLTALVSGALANPFEWRRACTSNACLAAVTGKAALGDGSLRASHCASFLATTVTPPAITVTETLTGVSKDEAWKRASVTVCPNEVPNYASACDEAGYTSACSCFGFTAIKTTTIAPTTTTKTVYVAPTGSACSTAIVVSGTTCPAAETETSTVIKTVGGPGSTATVTDTITLKGSSTCAAGSTVTKTVGSSAVPTTLTETVTLHGSSTCAAPSTVSVTVSGSRSASTVTSTVTLHGSSTCAAASTVSVTVSRGATATTVTKTVGSATASTVTVTVGSATATTVTVTASTFTVTKTTSGACSSTTSASATPSTCVVDDDLAETIVNNFIDLLLFTSYAGNPAAGIPAGHGYHQNVSDATLAADFSDISDSINFMAGFPLGSVTFPTKQAFDIGQGVMQPEAYSVQTLNIWHDCSTITWRWRLLSNPNAYPVTGINQMIIDEDGKIQKNYAEFDNGAWLQSFGRQCATNNITISPNPPALKRSARLY
ncbi:uncharacterized protein Z518_02399 [Rhinocladiella mackenziei CBS 650.93]|uniref:Rhinocladiella mackenziei CBS 650.93 unplaced genomic scaffold supercont1.2, whole genome shotgun sequence n=1 Tax=Rhinocladiella mackenziei CBS 650.93 TaxID=1442369 RepID=A0A0D2JEX2_9EURO|nr:uncharacterized protein Z518_02399 [Rhinocladiella mackenziei CBS 650.93]KIX07745.1 hypothetical protein Z518_02399 [Rhinocladiella mackenziei CBS 650.93]